MHTIIIKIGPFEPHLSDSNSRIRRQLVTPVRKRSFTNLYRMLVIYFDTNFLVHSANKTTATLRSFKWEVLQHPPYGPDLAPSDFHLFGRLSGERFPDDNAVERAVCVWFRQQPQDFYAAGFQGLLKRWDKFLNLYGDYVEK